MAGESVLHFDLIFLTVALKGDDVQSEESDEEKIEPTKLNIKEKPKACTFFHQKSHCLS